MSEFQKKIILIGSFLVLVIIFANAFYSHMNRYKPPESEPKSGEIFKEYQRQLFRFYVVKGHLPSTIDSLVFEDFVKDEYAEMILNGEILYEIDSTGFCLTLKDDKSKSDIVNINPLVQQIKIRKIR